MNKKKLLLLIVQLSLIFVLSVKIFPQDTKDDYGSELIDSTFLPDQTDQQIKKIVPLLLEGIWYNSNRYIQFQTEETDKNGRKYSQPNFILRTFYTWYDDRAAESPEFSEKYSRDRNDATRFAEDVKIAFQEITPSYYTEKYGITQKYGDNVYATARDLPSGAWILKIKYPGVKEVYSIPVCVIGNYLYLNFAVRNISIGDFDSYSDKSTFGYYSSYYVNDELWISPKDYFTELKSFFVDVDCVYPLRYWLTNMEYDSQLSASISDGEKNHIVPKHHKIGERNYTCVQGRGRVIRNLKKQLTLPEPCFFNSVKIVKKSYDYDSEGNKIKENIQEKIVPTIVAFGNPYMELDHSGKNILQIVEEANSRKKPLPPPVFPPHGILDFHWEVLELNQNYNRMHSIWRKNFEKLN